MDNKWSPIHQNSGTWNFAEPGPQMRDQINLKETSQPATAMTWLVTLMMMSASKATDWWQLSIRRNGFIIEEECQGTAGASQVNLWVTDIENQFSSSSSAITSVNSPDDYNYTTIDSQPWLWSWAVPNSLSLSLGEVNESFLTHWTQHWLSWGNFGQIHCTRWLLFYDWTGQWTRQ